MRSPASAGLSWLLLSSCATAAPAWFHPQPTSERTGAYELFLIAAGTGAGPDRGSACAAADSEARRQLTELLLSRHEASSEIVAVCGGPSRVATCIADFAASALREAPRTREEVSDAPRRCWVELRWLEPRHLAAAIRRQLEAAATADEVGLALKGALANEPRGDEQKPVQRAPQASPTPEGAIGAGYRGWYVRFLPVADCDTHLMAFVGAPGGTDARWLELKRTTNGWLVIEDENVGRDGWPEPPPPGLCD
jgi:hypothetical protein